MKIKTLYYPNTITGYQNQVSQNQCYLINCHPKNCRKMKKTITFTLAALVITACISCIWAFRTANDPPASYSIVNLYGGPGRYAVLANSDGIAEELKFDKGISDPQVIIQITSKLETKGYTLEHYTMSYSNLIPNYSFIFKKKP